MKTTKICAVCKQEKLIEEFIRSYCIPCKKEYDRKNNKARRRWNSENKEKFYEYSKKQRNSIKGKIYTKKYNTEYYQKNKEKIKAKNRIYNPINNKKRRNTEPLFRLTDNIRSVIHSSFNNNGYKKSKRTEQILGCTFEELKQHLEKQFEPWMNWENRGGRVVKGYNTTWDIDHIIPITTAKTEEDIIRLNHYTNLQPLCSYVNRYVKKDKLDFKKSQ